ncbi:hypothetical protein ACIQWA_36575 [Kitasatospora sp. NPDC098652]|uniref:hypothetical protein n=1 Tax=Kitasatospora sp. NPDC098652 TaxID=3364095 RepID=UPI003824AAD5
MIHTLLQRAATRLRRPRIVCPHCWGHDLEHHPPAFWRCASCQYEWGPNAAWNTPQWPARPATRTHDLYA